MSPRRAAAGAATDPDPERSVFINCPYDPEYRPLFDAIIFATAACGYVPRSAVEKGDVSKARMDRIFSALTSSKYSIHDFSRCQGGGDKNLARFNMPLEFGMAFDKGYSIKGKQAHEWLVLVPQELAYAEYVSDLGGYDLERHEGTVQSILPPVLSWLAMRRPDEAVPAPDDVLVAMRQFQRRVDRERKRWRGRLPWRQLLTIARETVPPMPKLRKRR